MVIVRQARKSLLFSDPVDGNTEKTTWKKKNGLFDVTMGAPDGAEICELVGLLILYEIRQRQQFKDLEFGLYRDDGLAVHRQTSGRTLDQIRQRLENLFNSYGLRITVGKPGLHTE